MGTEQQSSERTVNAFGQGALSSPTNHISIRGIHTTNKGLKDLNVLKPKPIRKGPDYLSQRSHRDIKQASKAVFYITVLLHSH